VLDNRLALRIRAWLSDDDEADASTADTSIPRPGARSMMMNVPGEERLLSHGLSTSRECDGFFISRSRHRVVGGGDSAMERGVVPHTFRLERHGRAPA